MQTERTIEGSAPIGQADLFKMLRELIEDVGALKKGVENLEKVAAEHTKTLKRIMTTISIATGAMLIIGYIVSTLIDKGVDQIMEGLATK